MGETDKRIPMALVVGKPHPSPPPFDEGAALELFRNNANRLVVSLPDISQDDIWALRKGKVEIGLMEEDTAIMLLWRFLNKRGEATVELDTTFDARLIAADERTIPDKTRSGDRLAVLIEALDGRTKILKAIRLITLPLAINDALLAVVMKQLSQPELHGKALERESVWRSTPYRLLFHESRMYPAGI